MTGMAGHGSIDWEADIVRSATRNGTTRPGTRTGEGGESPRPASSRRQDSDAERHQEQLWADCIAKDPDILSDIVNFIEGARTRLVESPPVAPSDDTKPDRS
jgi:hypothetical protein